MVDGFRVHEIHPYKTNREFYPANNEMNQDNGDSCKQYGRGRIRMLQPRLEYEVALTVKLDAT